MAGISVSGLISNSFDWKTVVDQLIEIDSAPIARLNNETADNNNRLAILANLRTRMESLQTSANALAADGLFNKRSASSNTTSSTWAPTVSNDADIGSYAINVSQLATAARLKGASGISSAISSTDDVSGVTLATMTTATAATAGNFTINGQQVAVELTDSLEDIFTKISDATGGVVTASYSAATDKITLASNDDSEIVLGAANDSSNLLAVLRLANNGTDTLSSSSTLGAAKTKLTLANAGLRAGFGGVDGSGNGAFAVNGVSISYNVNTDTLSNVLARITASDANVTATYDSASDRVLLTNKETGDTGVGVSDTTGSLLSALGLTSGTTLSRGKNALFTVNGGDTITSTSNTLTETAHGIAGLSLKVSTATDQTITIAPDSGAMKSAIKDFIAKFNSVQSYIDTQSQITKGADGKVQAALLSDNREVQGWTSELRALAFGEISGLSGTIKRIEHLGLDFGALSSQISIKDEAKLDAALEDVPGDVGAFFNTASTGFSAKFDDFVANILDTSGGALDTQSDTLNKQNASITAQIAAINKRLAAQRELLTNSFLAMQDAQSTASNQQKTIDNMFASKSSNN